MGLAPAIPRDRLGTFGPCIPAGRSGSRRRATRGVDTPGLDGGVSSNSNSPQVRRASPIAPPLAPFPFAGSLRPGAPSTADYSGVLRPGQSARVSAALCFRQVEPEADLGGGVPEAPKDGLGRHFAARDARLCRCVFLTRKFAHYSALRGDTLGVCLLEFFA